MTLGTSQFLGYYTGFIGETSDGLIAASYNENLYLD
jgi:hypothetical protein